MCPFSLIFRWVHQEIRPLFQVREPGDNSDCQTRRHHRGMSHCLLIRPFLINSFQCCKACGHKGLIRSMAHSLSNFIVRQHKNKKIADKGAKGKKGEKEQKSTTKDIYAGEGTEDIAKAKVNGKAAKDEWEGEEWAESDSEDEDALASKLSLLEMKPSTMSGAQKGEAFELYLQQLIDDGSFPEMMKAKEKIMQIVLKAEYYGLKQKGKSLTY